MWCKCMIFKLEYLISYFVFFFTIPCGSVVSYERSGRCKDKVLMVEKTKQNITGLSVLEWRNFKMTKTDDEKRVTYVFIFYVTFFGMMYISHVVCFLIQDLIQIVLLYMVFFFCGFLMCSYWKVGTFGYSQS